MSGIVIITVGYSQGSTIFKGTVFLENEHLESSLFWKGIELICNSSCSHSLFQIYCLSTIGIIARLYHKYQLWYLLGFTGIYKQKSAAWRHQFQPSIFSIIVSSFNGSIWSDPYVKDTVFISKYLLQLLIIRSSRWLIRKNLKGMFIWGKPL